MAPKKKRPFNRYVTVNKQSTSETANTDGGFGEVASEYCKQWCRAWPLRGAEPSAMEHQQAITDWVVQMRYCTATAAITAKMWIVMPGGERLNITSVYDPDGRRREIEIRARQVA